MELNARDDDTMFMPGDGKVPANKWVKTITKFFAKHGYKVKSHDFRVTQATSYYYKATKDIEKTRDFIGHAAISTT